MFFIFSPFRKRRTITFERLQILQILAFQLVCSLELTAGVSEQEKRGLACEQAYAILDEIGIRAPYALIEAAVDSSLYALKSSRPVGKTPILLPDRFRDCVENSQSVRTETDFFEESHSCFDRFKKGMGQIGRLRNVTLLSREAA